MKRRDLDRMKDILVEMEEIRVSVDRHFTKFRALIRELADLLVSDPEERRIVDQERRFFRDIQNQFSDLSMIRKLSRRLPKLEFEVDIEESEDRKTVQELIEANQDLAQAESALKKLEEWFRRQDKS